MFQEQDLPSSFLAVPEDEMAFALTLFVSAANQKIGSQNEINGAVVDSEGDCTRLFSALCRTVPSVPMGVRERHEDESSLLDAFMALCLHYGDSHHQVAVSARVLAFYFLNERSAGAALDGRVQTDAEDERYVTLEPIVVEALASVPLGPSVLLATAPFLAWIDALESGRGRSQA